MHHVPGVGLTAAMKGYPCPTSKQIFALCHFTKIHKHSTGLNFPNMSAPAAWEDQQVCIWNSAYEINVFSQDH